MRLSVLISLALALQGAAPPTAEQSREISARLSDLTARLDRIAAADPLRPDVEVYQKAARWILRYPEEFYTAAYAANTIKVLDHGIERARELEQGRHSWTARKGRIVRAYRSRIDGSVQPYGLIVPANYDGTKPMRLDVVLHGRGATLNEVSFIAAHEGDAPIPPEQDYLVLEVFGRTNNAYRWSGETDVFEALASVRERYKIDPDRIVLRGFSMGGAGAWHIGLHYPSQWVAFEAGAGFTETRKYAKQTDLPLYVEPTLHIYDAVDYALNAFDIPFVGYGGEIDPQLQASINIKEQIAREGLKDLRALFLVGPQTPHRFHPESKKQSDAFLNEIVAAGRRDPDRIRFVTYTPRYNQCYWVTIDALEKPYERTEVNAPGTTRNVARLTLARAGEIDGQQLAAGTYEKRNGNWTRAGDPGLRKLHGLQGPIDDAFMDSFLCVRPDSGSSPILDRFSAEFAKYFRGDVPIKSASRVTDADIASNNLILFGTPETNPMIRRVLPKLPLRWPERGNLLAMIYPNPLNPKRYVVLNSGHTFHEAELKGTNALLFPRLGDYAIIRESDGAVIKAGLFDSHWK